MIHIQAENQSYWTKVHTNNRPSLHTEVCLQLNKHMVLQNYSTSTLNKYVLPATFWCFSVCLKGDSEQKAQKESFLFSIHASDKPIQSLHKNILSLQTPIKYYADK